MTVTVVIPTWNRRDLLAKLLARLPEQSHAIAEVIVVDNGSVDGSGAAAAQAGARVIALDRNEGFARAVNLGIQASRSEAVAVVNNDVELDADWLARLCEPLRSADVWFAAGKILNARWPTVLDGSYDLLSRGGCAWRVGHGRTDGPEWSDGRQIAVASWTAALFRADLFARAGYLDERFGSYLEDVEFGLRCAELGLGGWYVPEALAWHQGSATLGSWSARTVRLTSRNQVLLLARRYPDDWPLRFGWHVLAAQALWGLLAIRRGQGWSWLRGKIEGVRAYMEARIPGAHAGAVEAIIEGERQLRILHRNSPDLFWRLYFALTGQP